MRDPGRIVIVGAGPTGLGAAYRMEEMGVDDHLVLEAQPQPGGLASSFVDERGFTWDVGGHVQFSHYSYYDRILDRALGDDWLEHEREAWVWMRKRFIPYPFQRNIHRLDPEDCRRAVEDLERAASKSKADPPATFREWVLDSFGEGIAEIFLLPYNFKVWGYPPERLGVEWMGERVVVPEVERIRRNIRDHRDDVSWGPNHRFRFPLRGGTGAIWKGVRRLLPEQCFRLGTSVERIELAERRLFTSAGEEIAYDTLVSSVPLDVLAGLCSDLDAASRRAAAALVFGSVHILGVGVRGERPSSLDTKCWMYFPEPHSPYYRVTVFSNYSPNNVPAGDGYWSLMAEVCETAYRPIDAATLPQWTLEALRADRLLPEDSEVVSLWHRREEHGYPTPFVERDRVLAQLLPALERHRVYSRGRFGAWKYEVSNQDHAFMQGVELVDRLLTGAEEVTLHRPSVANSGVFLDRGRGE